MDKGDGSRWHPRGAAIYGDAQGPVKSRGPLGAYNTNQGPSLPAPWQSREVPTITADPYRPRSARPGTSGESRPVPVTRPKSASSASSRMRYYNDDVQQRPPSSRVSAQDETYFTAADDCRQRPATATSRDDHRAYQTSQLWTDEGQRKEYVCAAATPMAQNYASASRPTSAPNIRSSQTPSGHRKRPTTAKVNRKDSTDMAVSSSAQAEVPSRPSTARTERSAVSHHETGLADNAAEDYRKGIKGMQMQMAGIPDRNDFPYGGSKGWAAKRDPKAMYSFNPIRHTVDQFVVKDGRLRQERTQHTQPVPHLHNQKFNRVKGVVEYDDVMRPTGERWNPSYHERYKDNSRVFYNKTGTVVAFVDTMLRQGYKPNAV